MIVRDCQETLGPALESVMPFVDEMIVVDTGSVDGTREVAMERGARLFEFDWCDNFSAARNYSIDCATGDWIFWIDSDDVLPAESGRKLKSAIAEHPNRDAAFWVCVEQTSQQADGKTRTTRHGHLKLFPRHPQIRFHYRVHEQVAPAIKRLGLPFKQSGAVVRHQNADRSKEGNLRRSQRNLRLLELDLADHPDDPFVLMNLGMTLLSLPGEPTRTIECLQKSLELSEVSSPIRLNAYMVLATAYKRSGESGSELQTCLAAQQEFPNDPVLMLRLGGLYRRLGEIVRAADCFRRSLEAKTAHMSVLLFPDTRARAAVALGEMSIRLGHRQQAERLWQNFLKKHPHERQVRTALEKSLIETYSQSTRNCS